MFFKYTVFYVADMAGDLDFLTQKLGFRVAGKIELAPNEEGVLLALKDQDLQICLVQAATGLEGKQTVIFETENCLKEYLMLKDKDVHFSAPPSYTTSGLVARFTNNHNQEFILLEQRNYHES